MSKMSVCEAFSCALLPRSLESYKKLAQANDDSSGKGKCTQLSTARLQFHLSLAVTLLAAGTAFYGRNWNFTPRMIFQGCTLLTCCLTAKKGSELYQKGIKFYEHFKTMNSLAINL